MADPTPTPTPEPLPIIEPGWKTTEFWVTLVVMLISLLNIVGVTHIDNNTLQIIVGVVGLVAAQFGYTIARSIRKRGLMRYELPKAA